MSDRQEDKEHQQPEPADAPSQQRRRLVQIGGGFVVACAIVVGIVLAAAGPNGGDGSAKPGRSTAGQSAGSTNSGGSASGQSAGGSTNPARPVTYPAQTAAIPARKTRNLDAAVKAAGCRLEHPPLEGGDAPDHVEGRVAYKTNPPTSGDHHGIWSSDGNYAGVSTPAPENYVHSLEHGRIELQYAPETPARTIGQLQTVLKEPTKTDYGVDGSDGGFALLFENNTNMPYAVAATAWGHLLGCRSAGDRIFDAIRAFRTKYTLQAPEKITQAE